MSDENNKTLTLLDEVIRELERLMRETSAIGLDRARLSMILANCKYVRAGLQAQSGSSTTDRGNIDPNPGGRSDGLDCASGDLRLG
jgi:hypothetical protein